MALTVTEAFRTFLRDVVYPDPAEVRRALESRNRLLALLQETAADFPSLIPERHLPYGAFARGTKIRPLDDLDLMICLHGGSSTFHEFPQNRVEITVPPLSGGLRPFCFPGTSLLDSRRVLKGFATLLARLPGAQHPEVKRTGEAVSLRLADDPWRFDLVPCFCMERGDGCRYLLMPDRYGHWKKTDPGKDNQRLAPVLKKHGEDVIGLIRIVKYWGRRLRMADFSPYLIECLMLDFLEGTATISLHPDVALPYLLHYLAGSIRNDLPDPKGLRGNINHLNLEERAKISERAALDSLRAVRARELDREQHHPAAIRKWREILGSEFPEYG